jgi:hypothetical protein
MTITKKALKVINSELNSIAVAHMMLNDAINDNNKTLMLLWAQHGLRATQKLNEFGIKPDAGNGGTFEFYVHKYSHLELA